MPVQCIKTLESNAGAFIVIPASIEPRGLLKQLAEQKSEKGKIINALATTAAAGACVLTHTHTLSQSTH